MKSPISAINSAKILFWLFLLVIIFHFLLIFGVVPKDIVWGGKIKDPEQLMIFEAFSIIVNLITLIFSGVKAGILKLKIGHKFLRVMFWIMAVFFLLNTIGNLFAESITETLIFTPITLLISLLSLRIALDKSQ
jgi:hypothetical protein